MNEKRLQKLRSLPQRAGETWQGGLVRLPHWITGEGRPPYRIYAAMWLAVEADKVHLGKTCRPEERNLAVAVNALLAFACEDRFGGYRPGHVQVTDSALAEHLEGVLGGSGITVELVERLQAVERVLQHMLDPEGRPRPPLPGPLAGRGVTVDGFRRFAEAAAAFYRTALWQHLTDMDLVEIERPTAPKGMQSTIVLGNSGQTFGLGFAASTAEQIAFRRGANRGEQGFASKSLLWQVTFDPITELPLVDADLWEDHGLPVAGQRAYPTALGHSPGGRVSRPNADELAFLEGVLWAFSETTEAEIDSGRWSKSVATFDGQVEFTLAMPDLLNPPSFRELLDRGYEPDQRAHERAFAQVARYFEQHPADSMEEINRIMNAKFAGRSLDETICPPSTPLEVAQDLCYQAFEFRGRRAVQLARQALAVSPDCADAHVILAEYAATEEAKLEQYQRGMAAGERALGAEAFEKQAGHFWGITGTRPYMRARMGLAQTLKNLGRVEESVRHYQELLRLNPDDNQGVRYLLLPRLLELGRDAETATLLKSYDEPSAVWKYGKAVLAFRLSGGKSTTARAALRDAFRVNPYVCDVLLAEELPPMPFHYSPGSVEEAIFCAQTLQPAVEASPGTMQWLATQNQRRERERQTRLREKRRKQQQKRRRPKKGR